MTRRDEAIDEVHELMMAALDGEANDTERVKLERLLAEDPAMRTEYEKLAGVKELTMNHSPKDPGNALWQIYWGGVYRRLERGLGWILLSAGAIPLLMYGGWQVASDWFTNDSIPLWLRIAGGVMGTGMIILFVSVLRETLFFHKRERYKDIER
ncbi:MAG: anti-sigma factor family protein [Pseudomonadota bacterium]